MLNRSTIVGFLLVVLINPGLYGQYSESDWKDRDEWMKVRDIFEMAGVEEGHVVADIGCHQGYLSIRLAKYIGDNGKVYSVDVREDRLNKLDDIAAERGIRNIHTILGEYDDPKLQQHSIDVAFIIDAYHEMKDYRQILLNVKKALKPDGRILVLEKLKHKMIGKSREEQILAHTISPEFVENELTEAGFTVTALKKDLGYWEEDPDKKIWVLLAVLP